MTDDEMIAQGVNLAYIIDAYRDLAIGDKFLTPFFDKLIGNGVTRKQIAEGMSADEIKATWADDIAAFRQLRAPYLLYPEF